MCQLEWVSVPCSHICLKIISKTFHYSLFFFLTFLLPVDLHFSTKRKISDTYQSLHLPSRHKYLFIPISSHHPLLTRSLCLTYCAVKKLTQKNIRIKRTQKHWPELLTSCSLVRTRQNVSMLEGSNIHLDKGRSSYVSWGVRCQKELSIKVSKAIQQQNS